MTEGVFGEYAAYYDLLYRDKDYAREADWVARTLRECSPAARTVLEFGSGTGRHGRLLAEHGFDVLGVEGSETMAASVRQTPNAFQSTTLGKFDCVHADVRTVHIARTFDAVIALFHVVSYQTGNEDLLRTFKNAARHLSRGGVFLFDVWHGPAVLTDRPTVRVKRVENERTLLTRIAEPTLDTNTSVVTVRYTMLAEAKADAKVTRFCEDHRMRYLFPSEIDLIARQSDFNIERSEEFMTGRPASESTWGVAYVLRKQG